MGQYNDQRLKKKEDHLWARISEQKCISINRISLNWAEQISFYRFLNNRRVRLAEVIENQIEREHLTEVTGHVLAINDTTSINLQKHAGRLKKEGLGYIGGGAGRHLGFHLHPTICLGAEDLQILGLSSVQVWVREEFTPERKAAYKQIPIEQKASYKWIRAAQETKAHLPGASRITVIGDREADIYEEFVQVPDERTHLLIRSCQNRCLAGGGRLYEKLSGQSLAGEYEIEIQADRRNNRKRRLARLEVRFAEVEIKAPATGTDDGQKTVRLYAIEAYESKAPAGAEAVRWRLLTTHEVESYETARRLIGYYQQRWQIEQTFRVLKKQGLDIEASEMEDIESIKKLSVIAISVAVRTVQMSRSLEQPGQKLEKVFNEQERICLEQLNRQLEGKTEKQRNPYNKEELGYGAWVVARLGGWKGYGSQRPPGVITMKRGIEKFEIIFLGYSLTCV